MEATSKEKSASPSQNQSISAKQGDQNTQPQQAIAQPAIPSTVNATVSGELQLKSTEKQASGQEHAFYQTPEWWLVAWTFILVCVTARLAFFTKKLWDSTQTLATDAKKSSKKELRAYVLATRAKLTQPTEGKIKITVHFRNGGRTPAYQCVCIAGVKLVDFERELPSPELVAVVTDGHQPSRGDLRPGGSMAVVYETGLNQEQLDGLTNGKKAIYVFGELTYLDIFKKPGRSTKFRFITGGHVGFRFGRLAIAAYGNETT
jgi:hypothetical protein